MQFWHSAEVILKCNDTGVFFDKSEYKGEKEVSKEKNEGTDMVLVFFLTSFRFCCFS